MRIRRPGIHGGEDGELGCGRRKEGLYKVSSPLGTGAKVEELSKRLSHNTLRGVADYRSGMGCIGILSSHIVGVMSHRERVTMPYDTGGNGVSTH